MSVHCTLLFIAVLVVCLMTGNGRSLSKMDHVQFISQLLKQQENSVQVSDSNSSASNLNCSDLVQPDGVNNVANDKTVVNSNSVVSDNTSISVTQDMINTQILSQLQSISQRLTVFSARKYQCHKDKNFKEGNKIKTLDHTVTGTRKNATRSDPIISQTIFNVTSTLAAMVLSNAQVSGSNWTNVQSLASQDPVVQNTAIPHLNDLRQDVFIQNQVNKRLKE